MKWSKPIRSRFTTSYSITARKKGFIAEVSYSEIHNYFYFLTDNGDKMFNSLWIDKSYKTEEECRIACEEWIDSEVNAKNEGRYT